MPKDRQSLCWKCDHAVPNGSSRGCSWSRRFQPVEGWEAEQTTLNCGAGWKHTVVSYHVVSCPKYKDFKYKKWLKAEYQRNAERREAQRLERERLRGKGAQTGG